MSFTHIHAAIQEANREFYRDVDIALDLSDAWFSDLEVSGVQLGKIRTDPDRQIKCCCKKAAAFLAQSSDDLNSEVGRLVSASVDRCCEQVDAGFLIASGKSGKARTRFLALKALCEEHDLWLE